MKIREGNSLTAFEDTISEMPSLLDTLVNSPMFTKDDIRSGQTVVPQKGIYVFHEKGTPIYVGRSNKIKQRISDHTNQSSGHFSATFAFRLAKRDHENRYQKPSIALSRQDLQDDPDFSVLYRESKERVARMGIKAIKIEDPITQTLFEVYAAMKLNTLEYNSFDNH